MTTAAVKEKLWGEFEDSNDDPWGDHSFVLSDYEELLTPRSYPPGSTALHQPSQQLTSSFQILSGELTRSDVTVQNTIRLLQHTRHVAQLINRAQSLANSGSDSASSLPPCPAMPAEMPLTRAPLGVQPLNFLLPQTTAFTSGEEGGLQLQIEHGTARKMLRQAVALVLVHAGFTDSCETVLRTLTDLMHDFLTKLTKTYRTNVDNSILNLGYSPFHDVLEQTLQEMHLGGLRDLHTMYMERVQNYHNLVKANALQLTSHYSALISKQQQQKQQQQQQPQHQVLWQSNGSKNGSATAVPFSTVLPTAGGGSINITIGALPGTASINFPNMTACTSADSPSSTEFITADAPRGGRSSRFSSGGRSATPTSSSGLVNLEQEMSRQYTPVSLQNDTDGRNQNSPLSAHFSRTQQR
ncbi:STAGA complex 65 subunit gamma [Hyalella azteca]|uniref:STAGA complex 65 subunit gamma n=1 Tax=Hyalella azteca TaxID=294128 RepID=A0A8B7NPN4_HYAAZ|nr:STAGA complex 65 subunit gamma [Hyalella azteca]